MHLKEDDDGGREEEEEEKEGRGKEGMQSGSDSFARVYTKAQGSTSAAIRDRR